MTVPEQKKAVTPRLRFPEFRDAGPWEVKQLRELLDYERPDKYIVESDNYEPQGIPVLTANKSFILGYTSEQNGIYEDLPAIIFDDFTTDKKFVDFPFKVKSSAIKILKPKGENNIRFVFELMNLIQFDPGQHKRYYISEYQHISVLVPNTAEQQKIADCLSSLDELIELQAKKLEALQAHKNGLMQQLFPREGETTPRLRFPEFRNAGPWEVKRLGDVCDILDSQRKPVSSINRRPGPYPYYGASGVIDFIDQYIFDERLLLIGEDGAKWGPYEPKAFIVEGKYWVNNHAHVLRPNLVNDKFLETYLTLLDISPYITGNAPPKLTLESLKSIYIPAPTAAEQQKIADCLSSLDELIELQAKKLEALKAHKKGLMQQLFPNCEL